jgi:DNA-3-methyladenine glycosylase
MHGKPGTIYIYLIYGMHWMLNIVTEEKDYPAAILLRGTEHSKGPGVVTRDLGIDKNLNGKKLGTKSGLWIEDDGEKVLKKSIARLPRVGVSYAGPVWSAKPYRFVLNIK